MLGKILSILHGKFSSSACNNPAGLGMENDDIELSQISVSGAAPNQNLKDLRYGPDEGKFVLIILCPLSYLVVGRDLYPFL
jgi:hypothetical protein